VAGGAIGIMDTAKNVQDEALRHLAEDNVNLWMDKVNPDPSDIKAAW